MELQFDVSEENKEQQNIPSAPLDPNIEIRTMKSDIKALKESGGDSMNISAEEAVRQDMPRPTISDKQIFVGNQDASENNSSIVKMMIIIIVVLMLAAGIGFASYYLASEIFK